MVKFKDTHIPLESSSLLKSMSQSQCKKKQDATDSVENNKKPVSSLFNQFTTTSFQLPLPLLE